MRSSRLIDEKFTWVGVGGEGGACNSRRKGIFGVFPNFILVSISRNEMEKSTFERTDRRGMGEKLQV